MSTFDRSNIGYEHNELRSVATRLKRDMHTDSVRYQEMADTEQAIYDDLTDLAKNAYTEGAKTVDNWKIGANLVDYLLERGWTPPAHFNGRIIE